MSDKQTQITDYEDGEYNPPRNWAKIAIPLVVVGLMLIMFVAPVVTAQLKPPQERAVVTAGQGNGVPSLGCDVVHSTYGELEDPWIPDLQNQAKILLIPGLETWGNQSQLREIKSELEFEGYRVQVATNLDEYWEAVDWMCRDEVTT